MITLTYYSKTKLDISTAIAEQWRENVTQQSVYQPGVGTVWRVDIQVQPEDSSYRYRALMQKPQLVLKFNLPFYFEFPVGTSCIFQNQRFILTRAQDLKKQGTRKIEYTMTLGTNEDFFGVWKIRNVVDPLKEGAPKDNRLKFSLCAKPHEFIDLIVRNLNKKDTSVTWERGECIEASEKTVEFNHTFIDAGLTDICNVFQTEYEVEYIGTTRAKIHLRRVEYFKTEPVALSYGVGNGFIPGVGRTSEADGVPVKRMLVQGSDRNIDRAKYGSPELLLPKSQTIRYDGTHFEDEDGFNSAIARTYKSNADGDGVERIDKVSDAVKEDSIDCSEIYPSRVGEVTAVEVENEAKNFYNIIDSTIPDNLNYNNYLIAGETMTIIFQDGMLAGKEFDVHYKHEQRKFEIVPQEIDGVIMPDKTWCPVKEQTYAIFGIQLPDEYICNNTNKSGGSWDMMRAAVKALYECEDQRFTFTGSLQSLWAKRHWLEVGGKLVVGGHVLFQDEQFAKDGVVIRIVGIKDFLTSPYSPTIELSNSVSGGSSVSSQIRQITNTEVVIDDTKRDILQFTKRRFRDAKETIEMLEDAQLDMFTNAISPIAVQAMSLLIGDESLQFQFVSKSGDIWTKRATPVYWDNEKKQLLCTMTSGGLDIYLQHLTIGHNAITTKDRNDAQGYLTWSMKSYTSPVLTDASAKYYLYAKCPKDTELQGEFVLTQTSIKLDEVAKHYHFLVGLLNAEVDGERSFVAMHGFTEILPGRITTDNLVSTDGNSWLNLQNGQMKLGDKLYYDGVALYLDFLFSEGANIGGWIFRNNRLESQNGKLYLDGKNGEVNIGGVIRYATATQGKLTDANLIWLPQTTEAKTITVLYEREHLGKVIKCFNSNNFGGKNWRIALREYTYSQDENGIGFGSVHETYQVIVRPQETIEIAYLQKPYAGNGNPNSFAGRWEITGRFSQELFINETDKGRFPRLLAMGRMNYNNNSPYISGSWWDASSITSKLSVVRQDTGKYRISFNSADIPAGYKVIVSGYGAIAGGSNSIKAGVYETASTYFDVHTSDDASNNDGSFDFIIFAPNWEYKLS